ncbi:MAG TPA: tripartite tricarboxylate transporter substrate binding protein [Casimicrobiaceae bacterium]|nr:tripartite tricarboxylate transporter substrate binding protein [Casimicrobiaceae bacterium]
MNALSRLLRRSAWIGCALAVVFIAAATPASAQRYPDHPIKLIVPVPPGGGVDLLSRAIGAKMQQSMGQPVVIENKAGASAAIGTEALAKSPPDGYTIMMGYSAHATNPIFVPKLPYDTNKDFATVAHVGYIPLILVVNASSPYHSVKELIAAAKAKPGQLQFASGGAGAGAHLSGELLKTTANVDIVHVPYKGNAPALNDLLGGQVTMMFDTITTSLPHVKSGALRALAVTSPKRSPLAPDVPTMIEAGLPDFDISAWYVMFAPAGTPRDIIARLNAEVNKAIADPDLRKTLGEQGVEFTGGTPEYADQFVRSEIERWGKIIKTRGMTGN